MENIWFSGRLHAWYAQNRRDLPWRKTSDPYLIWLSEIILQQTRVAQGLPYYLAFEKKYPEVTLLSEASEEEVLRLWQGLGYYSRARNMHAAARYITAELAGKFPETYENLLKIKGIGNYTAAAIASFAFDESVAVVDGNVYRVLARIFGIEEDIGKPAVQRSFRELAATLLPAEGPGLHNQAVMEFGALHCVPRNPDCGTCVFSDKCLAFAAGQVHTLPVKLKKTKVRERFFNYLVIKSEKGVLMKKRSRGDIWQGLYDFYLVEGDTAAPPGSAGLEEIQKIFSVNNFTISKECVSLRHVLSHQVIQARFWEVEAEAKDGELPEGYAFFDRVQAAVVPKPILIDNYLKATYF